MAKGKEPTDRSRFRIGAIAVHPDRNVIIRDGEEIDLARLTMDLLVELSEADGKAISRDNLLKIVWKNKDLDDNPINKAMSELRDKLGDDRSASRYIKTIRGGGYRTVAPIVFPKGYRRQRTQKRIWSGGSPYVGLASFDEKHTDVFFGRYRMEEKVLRSMRTQLDKGRRFVLLHGASGSGKTSLLRASIIPTLTKPVKNDDLHALAVAYCDLASAQPGDTISALAAALSSWTLGDRLVFPPQSLEDLQRFLIETPESIERVIDNAFQWHSDRKAADNPLTHLLLVIDHAEKLVDVTAPDSAAHDAFSRTLSALCDSEHTLTVMIVRGDFYLKLQEALPDLIERKGSDGHIDVLRPRPGEIAEIIRYPAECAQLDFEQDPETDHYLDDQLILDAQGKPDVLPLLQHALQRLYEQRDETTGMLTFAAYRAMGGLEGAIANRAEEVFNALPPDAQGSLDNVLSQLIAIQIDAGTVSGKHSFLDALDESARTLVQAFIAARLFASERGDDHPTFSAAHEALLRQWPRAADWVKENHRLLQAKSHLKIAASRWNKESRNPDHLLNPGRPLSDATEATIRLPGNLEDHERDYLQASTKLFARKRWIKRGAVSMLTILTAMSITMALIAHVARQKANARQAETQELASYIIQELAEKVDRTGNLELLESLSKKTILHYQARPIAEMGISDLINYTRALRILGQVRSDQGVTNEAEHLYAIAAEKAGMAIDIENDNGDAWFEMTQSIYHLGELRFISREYADAERKWSRYLRISEEFTKRFPNDIRWVMEESYALNNLGSSALRQGKTDIALELFLKSTDLKKVIVDMQPENLDNRYAWIDSKSWIFSALEAKGDFAAASKGYDQTIQELKNLIGNNENAHTWRFRLANYLLLSSSVKMKTAELDKAKEDAADSVVILSALSDLEPENIEWNKNHIRALEMLTEITSRELANRP
jgi:eukaryotic-like serine/threonine-protein kinase